MVGRKLMTIAAAAAIFLAWGVLSAHSQDPVATRATVGSGTIRLDRCQTYWADERIVSSKIPGKIDRRLVQDGQEVNEDDVLVLLDARDAEIELAIQEILGNSDLDEQSQREKLNEYVARLDAASKLIGPRAISEEEYRLAVVNVNVNRLLTLKEGEKRTVEHMKADRARVFLDDHVIKSPIRGIVKKCFKREKESVTNSDLQLIHIVATDKVWVEGSVPVSQLYKVKIGQPVEVKLSLSLPDRVSDEERKRPISSGTKSTSEADRSEGRLELPQEKITFPGKIVFIDPDASFTAEAFRVRAEVDNQLDPETGAPILRAGLRTTMKIQLNQ
jgi:multidrug efflux pump subunit AcrA (membrane-fusion protein)